MANSFGTNIRYFWSYSDNNVIALYYGSNETWANDLANLDKSKINELLQKAEANLNTQSTDKERYVASYKLETLKEISQ